MDALLSRRKLLKTKLTRVKSKLDKHVQLPMNLQTAKVYDEHIQELWVENNALFNEFMSNCPEDENDDYSSQCCELSERFIDVKVQMRFILDELNPSPQESSRRQSRGSSTQNASNVQSEPNLKLPKLNIPTFNGSMLDWTSFHDLYTSSIHNHPTLKGSQKLQYLKSALSGDAAALLKSFQISDANYAEAWDTLRKRYQNLRELVKSQLSRFLEMPVLKSESGTELRRLVDTSSSVVRALKALKRPIADDSDLAMHIISTRLDTETIKLWETRIGRDRVPTLAELLEFLDDRASILSSSESGKIYSKPTSLNMGFSNKKAAVHTTTSDNKCKMCKQGNHPIFTCKRFIDLTVTERRNKVKQFSLCFNCLRVGHNAQKCCSKSTCKKCEGKHHSLLHMESPTATVKSEGETGSVHAAHKMSGTKRALLATVLVNVNDAVGQIQTYRALLDPGADVSCVSEKCVQLLGIRRRNVDVEFSGIGASSVGRARGEVKLSVSSRCDADYHIDVDAYVFNRVTGDLPKIPCKTDEISPYMKLPLADPEFFKTGAIDILLGADVFFDSLRSGQMRLGENLPVAHETTWGWIVGGICPSQGLLSATVNHVLCDEAKLDTMLAKFWAVEEVLPHKQILTAEEKQCEVQFMETTTKDETGRFVVDLPFKLNHPRLGRHEILQLNG